MFTDTKNLTNDSAFSVCTRKPPKGKSGKIWKPLLRLIATKPAKKNDKPGSGTSVAHPNNINLNNAVAVKAVNELGSNPQLLHKDAVKECLAEKCASDSEEESGNVAIISRVSVDKTPVVSEVACLHGRNCQHQACSCTCSPAQAQTDAARANMDVPIHCIATDEGTFFWTLAENDTYDELLHAWLCRSVQQLSLQEIVS